MTTTFSQSKQSKQSYFNFRHIKAKHIIDKIKHYKPLKNSKVLDIGCGVGGIAHSFWLEGSKVTGIDLNPEDIKTTKSFCGKAKIDFYAMNAANLKFPDNTFDICILSSMLEHVDNPKIVLKECFRVLKKGGILYVDFPPYYSFFGHHLYDYIAFPVHYFPQKLVRPLIRWYILKQKGTVMTEPKDILSQFESLNKLSIKKFNKMIFSFQNKKNNFSISKLEQKFCLINLSSKEISINFIKYFGLLSEIFTMLYISIIKKE